MRGTGGRAASNGKPSRRSSDATRRTSCRSRPSGGSRSTGPTRGAASARPSSATAFLRLAAASRVIGIRAVLVHAIDDEARAFYLKHAEFLEFPAQSRTLFLPIETIAAAV